MNAVAWSALAVAGAFAAGDWLAVVGRRRWLEYACKPAAMLALIAAAVALTPHHDARRWAFVVALGLSLIGDVFLMLPGDRFVPGVAAFFAAHIAYIVGLRMSQTDVVPLLISALIVFLVAGVLGRRILEGVRGADPQMTMPVAAYIAAISVMVASALASGMPLAATGASLFMASDTLIAWNRFVTPLPWAPITIIVTYHLAQAALVLSLAL